MDPEWAVYVRDPSFFRQGQLDDYQGLELIHRWRDVGAFTLEIHRDNRHASNLVTPGWGIIVQCGNQVIFNGPVTGRKHNYDGKRHKITLTGVDDNIWLRRRLVSPCPAEMFPPYTTSDYDVSTGPASAVLIHYVDVNLGPGAVTSRIKPHFEVASDPGVGATVTGRGRWQFLLSLLQELATAGGTDVGFRVVQSTDSGDLPILRFEVYRSIDRTETVKFSADLGNLAAFDYESQAPDANYIFVGGMGEGTARTIVERLSSESVAEWERIEGEFVDRRDTSDATELAQAGDDQLSQATEKTSMSITPIDTPQQRYARDYNLGDKVRIEWEEGTIQDAIREVKISLTPTGPQKIEPSVGTVSSSDIKSFFRTFRRLRADVANLKRR
jgi:hypothetical protein